MSLLVEPTYPGLLFIVSAPAGAGKTTLVQLLIHEFTQVVASVSFTTRPPREGEINSQHYYFVDQQEFQKKIDTNDFLEHVELYGTSYGTSKQWIEQQRQQGKHVILVIDTQGAELVKKILHPISIFIHPPSIEVLKDRLIKRQSETVEMINRRLERAQIELAAAGRYDYQLINDDLQLAYQVLKSIIIAECHRSKSS